MVFNTTSAEVIGRITSRSASHAVVRQMLYAVVGGLGAAGVWFLGYRAILRMSGFFLCVGTFLLICAFIPGIGQQINGARRWIGFGGYSFQPSEFVKILIPIYYIHVMTSQTKPVQLKFFLKLMAILAIPIGLILIEPDNGTVAIILMTLMVLFILMRLKWVYWALPIFILGLGGAIIASRMQHVPDRIRIYLHPESDLKGKGHQPHQAKIAAGSGGLWGRGFGESLQKLDYLPEARSDYIAAIFAEEFGFIGMVSLIIAYLGIAYLGFRIAIDASDIQGVYLVAVIVFLICFQAFLNLGVVSGLLPSKGTNLPFFSHGGSNLIANFIALCLILNVGKKQTASLHN